MTDEVGWFDVREGCQRALVGRMILSVSLANRFSPEGPSYVWAWVVMSDNPDWDVLNIGFADTMGQAKALAVEYAMTNGKDEEDGPPPPWDVPDPYDQE